MRSPEAPESPVEHIFLWHVVCKRISGITFTCMNRKILLTTVEIIVLAFVLLLALYRPLRAASDTPPARPNQLLCAPHERSILAVE
jgi:hypothetical protein